MGELFCVKYSTFTIPANKATTITYTGGGILILGRKMTGSVIISHSSGKCDVIINQFNSLSFTVSGTDIVVTSTSSSDLVVDKFDINFTM